MMFRYLLFVSVSTAVTVDVIKHHLVNNLDHSVEPCDNFFRHVCPTTLPGDEYLMRRETRLSNELLTNGYTDAWNPRNLRVVKAIQEFVKDFVEWDDENIIQEFYSKCLVGELTSDWLDLFDMSTSILQYDHNCVRAKQIFAKIVAEQKLNLKAELTRFDEDRQQIAVIVRALNAIHLTRHGIFKKSLSNIITIIGEAKKVLEEWVEDSPWVVNHNVTDIYFGAVDGLQLISLYDDAFDPILNVLTTFEQTYADCINRTQTTSFEGKLICYLRAKELKDNLLETARDNYYLFLPLTPIEDSFFEWNAFNVHPSLGFNFPMQLHATSDVPAILYGAAGLVVSHEVSHSLIKSGRSDDPLKEYFFSNETENCIENQLRKSCEIFNEQNIIYDGACFFPSSNDNIRSFDDDGADLLGGKVAYELAKRQYGEEFYETNEIFEKMTNQQLFFYSLSAGMCWRQYSAYSSAHDHSAEYMRVNSILAQNPDFKKAFQCEDDSRMVQSATEQCEIFGKDAPLNKLSRLLKFHF